MSTPSSSIDLPSLSMAGKAKIIHGALYQTRAVQSCLRAKAKAENDPEAAVLEAHMLEFYHALLSRCSDMDNPCLVKPRINLSKRFIGSQSSDPTPTRQLGFEKPGEKGDG